MVASLSMIQPTFSSRPITAQARASLTLGLRTHRAMAHQIRIHLPIYLFTRNWQYDSVEID